jgi:hypothetical protein
MRLKSNSAESCTPGAARPDHRGDDRLDLILQPSLVAWPGAPRPNPPIEAGSVGSPVGEQLAGFVDDRDTLRLHAVDRRRDQVADRAHLLCLERAAHAQHDRGGGLDLVAREQRALGSTRCTRAACTRSIALMVRASSPSSARK